MRKLDNINNIQMIVDYLEINGPSTAVELRKMLCQRNRKEYHRGYYTWYFHTPSKFNLRVSTSSHRNPVMKKYWYKQVDGKWKIGPGLPAKYMLAQ
jgi:hypothetical protein